MAGPTLLEIDATQETLEITNSRDAISLRGRSIETGTPTDGEVMTYSTSSSEWIYQSVDENVDDRVAALIQDSAGGGLTWTYDDSAGTLTPAYVGDSTLVTTGALNSGSITSGFTSIDVGSGAITTTGTVSGGVLTGTLSTASQTNITGVGTIATGIWNAGAVTSSGALNVAGAVNNFYRAVNSGNPEIHLGASTAEDMYIQTVYDSGAQTLDYVVFVSRAASGTADKGEFRFQPDESLVLTIDDGGLEVTGGVEVSTTLAVTGAISGSTSLALATGATVTGIDNGSLGSSATLLATQGSIKTYIDAQVTAQDLDLITDSGNIDIDLDSESLTLAGGTGLDSSASSTTVTFAIDSTVATLAGSQTLTNKTLTTPVISSISNTGTVTLPTSTDTLVGKATTDTLTNKSISGSTNTLSAIANGSLTNSTVAYGGVSLSLGGADTTPAFNLSDATAYPGDSSLVTTGTITSGTWQGTTVAVNQGGTGATSLTDGGVLLGSGTGAITATSVLGDGEILIGDASGDPATLDVGSSTAITILGTVATGVWNGTAIANANLANSTVSYGGVSLALGASDANPAFDLSDATAYTGDSSLVTVGTVASGTWNGTAVGVAYGGTAISSYAAGDIIYASGATTLAKLAKGSDTEVLTLASGVPTWAAVGGDITGVTAGTGLSGGGTSGTVTLNVEASQTQITSVGALGAGSITSGFGAIDVGSSSIDGGTITGTFSGNITGNVTGNCSGSAGSATGNAATATALQTARTIGGTSFDGTANIAVGLSATATALATARAINGTDFDGTAAITVTAAAGTVTGATLNSGVTASSLTSLGTIDTFSATGALTTIFQAVNDGNLEFKFGSSAAECLRIQAVYDSGAQTLNYVVFDTAAASGTANKGEIRFTVDGDASGVSTVKFQDAGVDIAGTLDVTGTITGNLTGNVTGNCSGSALTVTQAAQTAITSVGTLAALTTGAGTVNLGEATNAFSTEVVIRDADGAGGLSITDNAGTPKVLMLWATHGGYPTIGSRSNDGFKIITNDTTALTFDTSQNATFAGNLVVAAMSTSDPSSAGQLWNDSGTVKISSG